MVLSIAQPNDYVVMLDGTSLPAVLRPVSSSVAPSGQNNNYRLIGPVFSEIYCATEMFRRIRPILSIWPYILKYSGMKPCAPESAPLQDMRVQEFRII